jgi:sterol desaturase/sphingolipid hydroxylase (fatty acid hydroxylase superfamily)
MSKKPAYVISTFLFVVVVAFTFPSSIPALGITVLLFSLAISIYSIFQKHKRAEKPRLKIAKDILVLVFTLLLVIYLGGMMGLFAAQYAGSQGWGATAGFVLAMLASFAVGYAVHRAAGKITRA